MTAAQPVPAWTAAPVPDDGAGSLAASNGRAVASSALAALTAAAVADAAEPSAAVAELVDDLADVLGVRLTVHQRETLAGSLSRAIVAVAAERSR